MTYPTGHPYAPAPKPKVGKGPKIFAAVIVGLAFVALLMCGLGAALTAADGGKQTPGLVVGTVSSEGAQTGSTPVAESALASAPPKAAPPRTLQPADVKLTVKTLEKNCFGSAGCNVEYEIVAAWPATAGECDVTYEVRGLDDPQVNTLELRDDGQYKQDGFQYGQVPTSKTKLTAKATEVDCR